MPKKSRKKRNLQHKTTVQIGSGDEAVQIDGFDGLLETSNAAFQLLEAIRQSKSRYYGGSFRREVR